MAVDFIKEKKTRRLATRAAIAMGVLILLVVGLNAGLIAAIVSLSKDVKVVGGVLVDPSTNEPLMTRSADTKVASDGSLRDQKTGGVSVSTHGQKNVFEVTLTVSGHDRLDEQGSGDIQGHLQEPVAQVVCKNVLLAVSSIENGDDESLVKIILGEGQFWEPRMSAASYHLHENSFGIDALNLEGERGVFYDVNCEMSKEVCDGDPGVLCDAVLSEGANVRDEVRALSSMAATSSSPEALSFEDAFTGDVSGGAPGYNRHKRRLVSSKRCI